MIHFFVAGLIIVILMIFGYRYASGRKKKSYFVEGAQRALIDKLVANKTITDDAVAIAMRKVDRSDFTEQPQPYDDSPKDITEAATLSAPHMHAHALNELKDHLKPGMKALDIGSGSGYLTVCMAYMVGNKGKAVGIEHMQKLVNDSLDNIKKNHSHLLKSGNLQIVKGDGKKGWPSEQQYDAIHVGAATDEEWVPGLLEQLKNGGCMVIPVQLKDDKGVNTKQVFRRYTKDQKGKTTSKDLLPVRYVPLTTEESQRKRAMKR